MGKFKHLGKMGHALFAITVTTITVTYFYGMQYLPAILIGSAFGSIAVLFALAATNPAAATKRRTHPAAIPAPPKVEVEIAAQPGSDFYVPTPADFGTIIKTNVVDNRQQKALTLARALVEEYGARLAAKPQTSTSIRLQHELLSDYQIRSLAKNILEQRGWSMTTGYDDWTSLSPLRGPDTAPLSPADLNSIQSSSALAELLEERVHKPRMKQALNFAQKIAEGYKKRLDEETHTSTTLTVTVEAEPDFWVTYEAEEILAQRGWSISHISGSSYRVHPITPGTIRGTSGRGITRII